MKKLQNGFCAALLLAATFAQACHGQSTYLSWSQIECEASLAQKQDPKPKRIKFNYSATCTAKCKDGKCRSFSCSGSGTAETRLSARLLAIAELKAEVARNDGQVTTMQSVTIGIRGNF